jgi:hypothetical protein
MSLTSSLILSSHLILGFPNGFRFSNQHFVRISYLRYACYMLRPHSVTLTVSGDEHTLWTSSSCSFLRSPVTSVPFNCSRLFSWTFSMLYSKARLKTNGDIVSPCIKSILNRRAPDKWDFRFSQRRVQLPTQIMHNIRLSFLFQQFFTLTFRKFLIPTPVIVEWLTLLLRTQIFSRRSWPRCFVGFLSSSGQMPEWYKIKPRPLPSTSFPIHHSPINISLEAIQSELLKKRR